MKNHTIWVFTPKPTDKSFGTILLSLQQIHSNSHNSLIRKFCLPFILIFDALSMALVRLKLRMS